MDLLRDVVLFILLVIGTNGADFIISDDTTNWSTASERCTLAEPDLIFSSDRIAVNISAEINGEVWVGYYKARTAFEYFGCAVKDTTKTPIDTYVTENPGRCFSACDAQGVVGIFQNECFCFEENEIKHVTNTMLSSCNQHCSDGNGRVTGIACGGSTNTGENTYMSLYRSIGTDIGSLNARDTTFVCMVYLEREFHWHNCADYNTFICETENRIGIYNSTIYRQWLDSTKICFDNHSRPSTYDNTKNVHTSDAIPELWTGIVRSEVIYKSAKDSRHLKHAIGYGYIIGNSYELNFTAKEDLKGKLCVNGTSETENTSFPVTTTPSATSDKTGSSIQDTTQSAITEPSSAPPTTTVKSNETSSTSELKSEGSSVVGAAVGATLAIVAAIVIGIIIVLVLRKRGVKLPFQRKERTTENTNMSKNSAGYAISGPVEIQYSTYNTDQNEYADIDLKTTIDNDGANKEIKHALETAHGYLVLEKLEEEQYDTTKPEIKNSQPNTFNPYNTLSLEESSDYDHVGNGNMHSTHVPGSEDTYNTTSLGNSNLKTSKGAPLYNEYNMVNDPEDTYNHTNLHTRTNELRVSENDYDAI